VTIEPGAELVHCRVQWPMRGRELVWEVVAANLTTGKETILETWSDCRRAIARAQTLTKERIHAISYDTGTVQ